MEQFTILVKEFTTKDGTRKFTTASVQGKYLPESVNAEAEKWYRVKPVQMMIPNQEGKYDVICDNVWIDKRKDYVDKNIVRVKGSISFNKK